METDSRKNCEASITLRRSKLSAIAPETMENSMIGSEVEAWTRATMFSEDEIDAIIQAAPTAWIRPPILDARLANQMVR
ncbi:hypothetical protein D3C72_2449560 [compost metagenome]